MNEIVKAKGPVDNFVTMMNVSGVVGGQEWQIIPDHVLRQASNEEIRFIKGVLDQFYTGPLVERP